VRCCLDDPMFNRFGTILACDRRTDRAVAYTALAQRRAVKTIYSFSLHTSKAQIPYLSYWNTVNINDITRQPCSGLYSLTIRRIYAVFVPSRYPARASKNCKHNLRSVTHKTFIAFRQVFLQQCVLYGLPINMIDRSNGNPLFYCLNALGRNGL